MKNILVVITNFRHGGTNKSLENLLSVIDKEHYCVDIFGMEHFGPYQTILKGCNILPKNKWIHGLISHLCDNRGLDKIFSFSVKLVQKIAIKLNHNFIQFLFNKVSSNIINSNNYDAIIAYSEGVPTSFLSSVKHKNKIAWVHCDYSSYLKINNFPNENEIYNSYKSIVCVSNYTKKEFLKNINISKDRVHYLHNILNTVEIIRNSKEIINDERFDNKSFTIISVGRIDIVKNFNIIPKIVSELKEDNIDFKWYLIGPKGTEKIQNDLIYKIRKFNVEENFIWLNSKTNPYKYIIKSNLLVMTSKSEACPYVLNEAKILNVPVITTNYGSASEFIRNNVDGIITNEEQLKDKIKLLIINPKRLEEIKNSSFVYDNNNILKQFYKLIS